MPLANAASPYVGFPQFKLMQQLLLSWVGMDYPSDVLGAHDALDEEEDEEKGKDDHVGSASASVLLRHDCASLPLLSELTGLELLTFWSQMVKRDREVHASVPPPSA